LKCSNPDCGCAFCAICLKDCGRDAHGCAQSHGEIFGKQGFEEAREERRAETVKKFLRSQGGGAVRRLLEGHIAKYLELPLHVNQDRVKEFSQSATKSVNAAITAELKGTLTNERPAYDDASIKMFFGNDEKGHLTVKVEVLKEIVSNIGGRDIVTRDWVDVRPKVILNDPNSTDEERDIAVKVLNSSYALILCEGKTYVQSFPTDKGTRYAHVDPDFNIVTNPDQRLTYDKYELETLKVLEVIPNRR